MWEGGTRKSGKLGNHIGTHFPPGVLLSLPSSLPSAVQFQCLNDRVLHLLWRGSRKEIFVNSLFRDFKLLHLVRLFLSHDRQDHILVQLSRLCKLPHFNCLCMAWSTVLQFHCVKKCLLLFFRQVRQLYRRAHGNLSLVHHIQNRWNEFGKTDIAADCFSAFSRLFS